MRGYLRLFRDTGFRAADYLLAAIRNPRLFAEAARHVLTRRSRAIEGARRADRNPALRVSPPKLPQSVDLLLEGLSQQIAVLELAGGPSVWKLGVADVDMLSALAYLTRATPGVTLTLDDEPVNFDAARFRSRIAMAASAVSVHFTASGRKVRIDLEPYARRHAGLWVSPNTSNDVMRAVYFDLFETPGLRRAVDILGAHTLAHRADILPVDVVYTWVNYNDPEWRALYLAWKEAAASSATPDAVAPPDAAKDGGGDTAAGARTRSPDADTLSRFRDNGELRYSLRAVRKNIPWVNRIYVFTNCARPDWLRDDDRLIWVRHDEVIPAEFLPTFNSHVIESFLHRIPGLSEQFIYLNDDFFIMKPLRGSDFFTGTGLSLSRLESYGMVSGKATPGDPDYLNASRNAAALMREALGFAPVQLHQHVPYALHRAVLEEIEARFRAEIDGFRSNRFRRHNDINIPSFLYHHYALGCGRASLDSRPSVLVKSNDIRWRYQLRRACSGNYTFVCINEGGAAEPDSSWHSEIGAFLAACFPEKAEWEA